MQPFRLQSAPPQQPGLTFGADPVNLAEKHRPKTLADLVGQPYAVRQLARWLDSPHPAAWLLSGPTGTGKTSAALALANGLGVHPVAGLWRIDSGQQGAELMEDLARDLRFAPMFGWRLVIVEEADYMARCPKVADTWLSMLDAIPRQTCFVFTTNHPDKLGQRFKDRCEWLRFAADPSVVGPDVQALIDRIWVAETGRSADTAPRAASLPSIVEAGAVSYRRVVRALEPLVRDARPVRADASRFSYDPWSRRMVRRAV